MRYRNQPWLWLGFVMTLGGCTAPAPAPAPTPEAPLTDPSAFQGNLAWGHLEALAAIGPRESASEGSARAREYIAGQLRELGLEVVIQAVAAKRVEGDPVTLHNLVAGVPGESTDLILVIAPYDTRGFESFENLGVDDGGSGVAVNLELARLIAGKPLPYTTWFVFLEGEQEARGGIVSAHIGSRALAAMLKEHEAMEQVRLALIVNRVCDADLHIARDLSSHRVYREEFFQSAKRLGVGDAFDPEAGFESPDEGQDKLSLAGLRRVVVLADTSFGGDEAPGPYADSVDDDLAHCAVGSLDTVGQVALEGISVIAQRLRRIDRFAASPIAETEVLRLEQLEEVPGELPLETPDADNDGATASEAPVPSDDSDSPATADAGESPATPETSQVPVPSDDSDSPATADAGESPATPETSQVPVPSDDSDSPATADAGESPATPETSQVPGPSEAP